MLIDTGLYCTSGDSDQIRGSAPNLTQNQVVATSCWFESGQGHQFRFRQFPAVPLSTRPAHVAASGGRAALDFTPFAGPVFSAPPPTNGGHGAGRSRANLALISAGRGSADPGNLSYWPSSE